MLFFIGLILLIVFLGLSHKFHEDDSGPRVTDGPKLTPEQQKANYQSVRRFVENNPNMQFCREKLPEYIEDIEMTKRYNDLERRFKSGEISYADYQIELNELTDKVKIKL